MGSGSSRAAEERGRLEHALTQEREANAKLQRVLTKDRKEYAVFHQKAMFAAMAGSAVALLGGVAFFVLKQRATAAFDSAMRAAATRHEAALSDVRRRAAIDHDNAMKYSVNKFARDLMPVSDSLEFALKHSSGSSTDTRAHAQALVEGVQMTEQAFLDALNKHGIEKQNVHGDQFDPNLHEAVLQMPNPDGKLQAGEVADVLRSGFEIHGRVLRAAQVAVAAAPPAPVESADIEDAAISANMSAVVENEPSASSTDGTATPPAQAGDAQAVDEASTSSAAADGNSKSSSAKLDPAKGFFLPFRHF